MRALRVVDDALAAAMRSAGWMVSREAAEPLLSAAGARRRRWVRLRKCFNIVLYAPAIVALGLVVLTAPLLEVLAMTPASVLLAALFRLAFRREDAAESACGYWSRQAGQATGRELAHFAPTPGRIPVLLP